jgi:hypothetical protein
MMTMTKLLAGAAGLAAIAASAPAAAQYTYGNPYAYSNQYAYSNPYGNAYGYNNNLTAIATQQCSAAVQNRLYRRSSNGMAGIVGALLGANTMGSGGRVLAVTQIIPRGSTIRVRGLATSGRSSGYGPYGVGAYGALGYASQPDLSFKCDVDYRGYVRDVDIMRR